jgi:hypothetical protein
MIVDGEGEFLVLGADAELRLRLATRFEPGDEFVARLDWGHVDLVTSHAAVPGKKVATLNMGTGKGQCETAHANLRVLRGSLLGRRSGQVR